jgi:hypothetical protein
LAVVAVYLGTPLLYDSTVEPLNARVTVAFSLTLFVFLWLRARARRPRRTWRDALPWLWAGLAAGLAVLCHWHVVLVLVVAAAVEVLLHGRWRRALLLVGGFLLLAWLIPYSWRLVASASWEVLLATRVVPARIGFVLASPSVGLFLWSPVTLLALVGMWPLFRRDWRLASIVTLVFVLQVLLGGLVSEPEGSMAFGARRVTSLYPLYVLSLVTLLQYLALHERGVSALAQGLAVACAVYGVLLLLCYLGSRWSAPGSVSRAGVLEILRYGLSPVHWPRMWAALRERVGVWAWGKPGL